MRRWMAVVSLGASVMASSISLAAGTTAGTLAVSVSVTAAAKLAISGSAITFPSADPDVTPSIPASEGPLTVTAKARTSTGSAVALTVLAGGDLMSGPNSISVTNVSWTTTGSGFVPGAMNSTAAQTVGSWTGPGERTGTQSFRLVNRWAYATGAYAATATYTLIAP